MTRTGTKPYQKRNQTNVNTKMFQENQNHSLGSVVPEVIHRAKGVLSACELVVILGVLRTSSLVQGGDHWEKK